jgi:hypothetical protein
LGPEVVSANSAPRIALRIDGAETAIGVLENPDGPGAGAVEGEVIELAAAVVIEGEGLVG